MNDSGEIVGMVDVLKLTYATLEQINTLQTSDNEGPAWNKFWLSLDDDTGSMVSDSSHQRPQTPHTMSEMGHDQSPESRRRTSYPPRPDTAASHSVLPTDSASHLGEDNSPPASHLMSSPPPQPSMNQNTPFSFKFKTPSNRVHRVNVIPSDGLAALVSSVISKLGGELAAVGGETTVGEDGKIETAGFAMSYADDEGDLVSITSDQDLMDAVNLARRQAREKVDLFVHDPDHPPSLETIAPPSAVPAKKHETDDEDEEDMRRAERRRKNKVVEEAPQQHVPGVPNELLLPGAIATLAVVIVIVFAFSRGKN